MELELIKQGSTGELVVMWQEFLTEVGCYVGPLHPMFDDETTSATRRLEARLGYDEDGVVDGQLWGYALQNGLAGVESRHPTPPAPPFKALTTMQKHNRFGLIRSVADSVLPDGIRITNDWAGINLIRVDIPQATKVPCMPHKGIIMNKAMAAPIQALFAAWEDQGLLRLIQSWGGLYCARYVRRSPGVLSSHAWGTAFDINAQWNGLGMVPTPAHKSGSVIPLVEAANRLGFWWGGHWKRPDGMHFELAKDVL